MNIKLLVITLAAFGHALAANDAVALSLEGGAALDAVRLELKLVDNAPVQPRLPVLLQLRITNTAGQPVEIARPVFSERYHDHHSVELEYRRSAAVDWTPIHSVVPSAVVCKEGVHSPAPELISIDAGDSHLATVPVSYDWDIRLPRLIIGEGELQFRARLMAVEKRADGEARLIQDRFAESDVLKVVVPAPAGNEAKALAALEKRRDPWSLAAPPMLEHIIDEWGLMPFAQQLVTEYPDTTYALYARACLAHLYAAGELEPAKPNRRPADWPTAIRTIERVRSDPRYVLKSDAQDLIDRFEMIRRGRAEAVRNAAERERIEAARSKN